MDFRRLVPCLFVLAVAARAGVLHVPKDFATIQAAVDASDDGDTILIAAGSYDEQVVLQNDNGITLRGQGQVELTGTSLQIGLDIHDSLDVTVEKLRFVGLSAGLRAQGCVNLVVRSCRAADIVESGFIVLNSTKVLIDRCRVDGATDEGLVLDGLLGAEARHCTFLNVGNGISAGNCTVVEIDHLRVEHAASRGLVFNASCDGLDVHDSRIFDVGLEGMLVDSSDGHFRHDVVQIADGHGLQFGATAARNVLDGERVIGAGASAFELGGLAQEAHGCSALHPGSHGFHGLDSGQHLIEGCRVVSPAGDGVRLEPSADACILLSNQVTHAGGNGFLTVGSETTIVGNLATAAAADGFHIASSGNAVIGNTAHGSGDFDLAGSGTDSTYLDNHFGTVDL